jgi:dienelactone hydrolase
MGHMSECLLAWWKESGRVCSYHLPVLLSASNPSFVQTAASGEPESPVVLLYPGFRGPKEIHSVFASHAASAGYTVLVLQQLQAVGSAEPSNLITPTATAVALDWLRAAEVSGEATGGYGGVLPAACRKPDTGTVLLAGHSWGCTVVCILACT